ncbi:hypothetical protein GGF31_002521 [Allomyces arbusculus]|nr:hypothetical protein GGF31_002521 [Allomyces arbusculus]
MKVILLHTIGQAKGDKNEDLGKQHTAQEVVDALCCLRNAIKVIGVQAVLKPEYHVLPPRGAAQHNRLLETYVKKSQPAQAAPNQTGNWWTMLHGMLREKFNANMPTVKMLDLALLRDASQYVTAWMPIIMPMVLSNSLVSHVFCAANAKRAFYERLATKLIPDAPALVCFGNAGHLNPCGISAPVRKIFRYLVHAGARVVLLDECMTSKTCSLCSSEH